MIFLFSQMHEKFGAENPKSSKIEKKPYDYFNFYDVSKNVQGHFY